MLNLFVIGTGSSGNCYLLSDIDGKVLILDAGLPTKLIKQALRFDLSRIVGCICSHSHADHCKYLDEIELMGIDVFKPFENQPIRENRTFGNYNIQCFKLPHNGTANYGFLIRHLKTGDTLIYATDMEYCQYNFKACNVNHFLAECNYQSKYVDTSIPNFEHKIRGHCELQTCKRFLESNITPAMHNVIIVHMGINTCDENECCDEIEQVVPDNVKVDFARPNTFYRLE